MSDLSILVVEDEPSIAEVVGLYLKRAGYQSASDGKRHDIWRKIPDLNPGHHAPEVDGLSLTRWLRDRSACLSSC
jgi:DNA-binding response OmpR family regulator